jgi:hypothetical protein
MIVYLEDILKAILNRYEKMINDLNRALLNKE